MNKPLQILFKGVERSDAVEEHVRQKFNKLETFHPRISGCRVTIELPHHHHQQGKHFDVRVELTVPGREIVVNRDQGHQDMYMALHEAFDAARRQLDDHAREQRGEVKHHAGRGA